NKKSHCRKARRTLSSRRTGGITLKSKQSSFTSRYSPTLQQSRRISFRIKRSQSWGSSGRRRDLLMSLTLLLRSKRTAVERDLERAPPRRTKPSRQSSTSLRQCSTRRRRKRSPLRRTRSASWRVISLHGENL